MIKQNEVQIDQIKTDVRKLKDFQDGSQSIQGKQNTTKLQKVQN